MIQDKFHSVKTEQEKCSVFFALLGQSSPFILQEMGFLKNSTTYFKDLQLDKQKEALYTDFANDFSIKSDYTNFKGE